MSRDISSKSATGDPPVEPPSKVVEPGETAKATPASPLAQAIEQRLQALTELQDNLGEQVSYGGAWRQQILDVFKERAKEIVREELAGYFSPATGKKGK